MKREKKLQLIVFLIIGLVFGVAEDLLVVRIAGGATIDLNVFGIVFLVALPFAFLSEIVVDHPRFWEIILPSKKNTD